MLEIDKLLKEGKARTVPGWDMYVATEDGRVWSQHGRGRWLTLSSCSGRYLTVGFYSPPSKKCDAYVKTYCVHRVILLTFRGPKPSDKHQARHLDGNRKHNHIKNLVWGTAQENVDDRSKHGRTARGTRNGNVKLTELQVRAIKKRLKMGEAPYAIARDFPCGSGMIYHIRDGEHWEHVKDE